MANYLTTDTDLTAVADAIRTKGGTSAVLEFPDEYVSAINAISTGADTPTFTVVFNNDNTVTVTCDKTYNECLSYYNNDILTAIVIEKDQDETYEISYGATIDANSLVDTVEYKYFVGLNAVVKLDYTSSNTITRTYMPAKGNSDMTVLGATVTASAGWYPYNASKSVPSAPQATPTIAFSSNGLITATAVQTSGYVSAGTKTSTFSLTTRSAADITVNGSYVIAPSGYYSEAFSKAVSAGSGYVANSQYTEYGNVTVTHSTGALNYSTSISRTITGVVTSGYISSIANGTFSIDIRASGQLPTLAATTYTPTTTIQRISSYQWLTGSQTILGDANLVASNIKSGVSIFGITGTVPDENDMPTVYRTWDDNAGVYTYSCNYTYNQILTMLTNLNGDPLAGGFHDIWDDAGTTMVARSGGTWIIDYNVNDPVFYVYSYGVMKYRYHSDGSIEVIILIQNKNITPSRYTQYVYADYPYEYLTQVVVSGDNNLVPSNIRSGVSIFGVSGTMEEGIIDPYYTVKNYLASRSAINLNLNFLSSGIEYFNSLSIITQAQFAGQAIYSGTNQFVNFNNVTSIDSYGFAMPYRGVNITAGLNQYYNFPECTFIGSMAFLDRNKLIAVSFPKCITISANAFDECGNLSSISFPLCETIGASAFISCSKLTTAVFPKCTSIGNRAFSSCSSLTTISFPLCEEIDMYAFYNCSKLQSAIFPKGIYVSNTAFSGCSSLSVASFPLCSIISVYGFASCSSLTTISFPICGYIGHHAFNNCRSLTAAIFPSCTSIEGYAFQFCYSLSIASFPICSQISSYAFTNCSALTTISFPSCDTIWQYAFASCTNLTSIRFLQAGYISSQAFAYCSSLNTVILSVDSSYSSLMSIGFSAFYRCSNLLSLYLLASSMYNLVGTNAFTSTPISSAMSGTIVNITMAPSTGTIPIRSCFWGNVSTLTSSMRGVAASFTVTWNISSNLGPYDNCGLLLAFNNNGTWTEMNWIGGKTTQMDGHYWNVVTGFTGTKTLSISATPSNASQVRLGIFNAANAYPYTGTISASGSINAGGRYGSIYVPASLYASYISATNWATYSSRFVSLTDAEIAALTP